MGQPAFRKLGVLALGDAARSAAVFPRRLSPLVSGTVKPLGPKGRLRPPWGGLFDDIGIFVPRWDLPRDKLTVPVSPVAQPTPDTLFEDADVTSARRHYLPRYRVGEQVLDGRSSYQVALRQVDGTTSRLTIQLSAVPRDGGTDVLTSSLSAILRFTSGAAEESVDLGVELVDGVYTATREIATNNERDELYGALSNGQQRTRLLLRHVCTVALPVDGGLYRPSQVVLDVDIDRVPFEFSPQQHPYIYEGISTVGASAGPATIDRTVSHRGRTHHYFQSTARPAEFAYLPDAFKVVRRNARVRGPAIKVRFSSDDATLDHTEAALEYTAAPVFDAGRLEAAVAGLQPFVPASGHGAALPALLHPLVVADVDQLSLQLALPASGPGAAPLVERPDVVTSLTDPFSDAVSGIGLRAFQQVFDALFGASDLVFSGQVHVAGGNGRPEVIVPFTARMDDLVGEVFEVTEQHVDAGRLTVRMVNRAESPAVVSALPVHLVVGGATVDASVTDLTLDEAPVALPVAVPAGSTLGFRADPAVPAAAGGPVDIDAVLLDLSGVTVAPVAGAVWSAIVDPEVPAVYRRQIRVISFDTAFAPATDVQLIVLDFVGGGSVVLRPGQLEGTVDVQAPLADVVLRRGSDGSYTYTQLTVRASGQVRVTKSDSLDVLVPQAD